MTAHKAPDFAALNVERSYSAREKYLECPGLRMTQTKLLPQDCNFQNIARGENLDIFMHQKDALGP